MPDGQKFINLSRNLICLGSTHWVRGASYVSDGRTKSFWLDFLPLSRILPCTRHRSEPLITFVQWLISLFFKKASCMPVSFEPTGENTFSYFSFAHFMRLFVYPAPNHGKDTYIYFLCGKMIIRSTKTHFRSVILIVASYFVASPVWENRYPDRIKTHIRRFTVDTVLWILFWLYQSLC